MRFIRKAYFDAVRQQPFKGSMTQSQVDGQIFLLSYWEDHPFEDLRWFAYMLATTYHETAATMQPIEEYGKGQGRPYGVPDPETGQTYYGRGYVQLTWRDNYHRATQKLGFSSGPNDLEWHAAKALDARIAVQILFRGMMEGWFTGKKLPDYFNDTKDDPVNARAIINADVSTMGKTVAGYHQDFLDALQEAEIKEPAPPKPGFDVVQVFIQTPPGISISVAINGEVVVAGPG